MPKQSQFQALPFFPSCAGADDGHGDEFDGGDVDDGDSSASEGGKDDDGGDGRMALPEGGGGGDGQSVGSHGDDESSLAFPRTPASPPP